MTTTPKARPGRPRTADRDRLTERLSLRVSEADIERISAAAERDGVDYFGGNGRPSLSGWLRAAALEKAERGGGA